MKKRPRNVPSWDDYFMAMCFIVASRSKDPSTQHGAIIVDDKHRIRATGYNGVPASIADVEIDWSRPAKYPFIVHAESNAIDQAAGGPDVLEGTTIYITGLPCSECMKRIVSKKIRKVIYGPQTTNMIDHADWENTKELVRLSRITFERYIGNLNWLRDRISWMDENMQEVFETQMPIPI